MCIIIYAPDASKRISIETLRHCAKRNADGMGLMTVLNGKVVAHRQMGDVDQFHAKVAAIQEAGLPIAVHLRLATHGSKNEINCHPAPINQHQMMMHNGIITGFGNDKEDMSDTRDYAERVLAYLPRRWYRNPALQYLVASDIGTSNKLVVFDAVGDAYIVNEKQGVWDNGTWYSNHGFRITPSAADAAAYQYNRRHWDGDDDHSWADRARRSATRSSALIYNHDGIVVTRGGGVFCFECACNLTDEDVSQHDVMLVEDATAITPYVTCDACDKRPIRVEVKINPRQSEWIFADVLAQRIIDKFPGPKTPTHHELCYYRRGAPTNTQWSSLSREVGFDAASLVFPLLSISGSSMHDQKEYARGIWSKYSVKPEQLALMTSDDDKDDAKDDNPKLNASVKSADANLLPRVPATT